MVPVKTTRPPFDPLVTFRLLNVPQVVLTNILSLVDECELIKLSLCSKNAQTLVKRFRSKTEKYEFSIHAGGGKSTIIYWAYHLDCHLLAAEHISRARAPLESLEIVKINGINVPCAVKRNFYGFEYLITYWEDMILGSKTVLAYTLDLFSKNEIEQLQFGLETIWMIEWFRNRETTMGEANMIAYEAEPTYEQYDSVLRNCNALTLTFFAKPPPNFKFDEKLELCQCYSIRPGTWITIRNLMEMDSKYIMLDSYLELNNSDINKFLKHWLAGGSPKLEYMTLDLKSVVFEEIVAGFEDKVQKIENKEYFSLGGGLRCMCDVAYSIQRGDKNDGAFIFWSHPRPGERQTISLRMIVGPEPSDSYSEDEED